MPDAARISVQLSTDPLFGLLILPVQAGDATLFPEACFHMPTQPAGEIVLTLLAPGST